MSLYQDYLDEIEARKADGLSPKPIDEAALAAEIVAQIKDADHPHRAGSLNHLIYNTLPGTTGAAGEKAEFLKEIILGDVAVDEIVRFYANFHSIRSIGDDLVVRMHRGPDDHQLADLNERFDHLVKSGSIRRTDPYGVEKRQDDHVELDRIAFEFDRHGYAELRGLIDALNHF